MSNSTETQRANAWRRRHFLKGSLLLGVGAVLGPSLLVRAAQAAEGVAASTSGGIMTGSHWGAFRAIVENGRISKVIPISQDPRPSPAIQNVVDVLYSPSRIKYPMVRASYLKNGPGANVTGRGEEEFVRVSWDQAIDLVAKELQRVWQKDGPSGIYAGSYGWKSVGKLHNCQNLMRRMLNAGGGFVSSAGDYSTGASQVIMPHVVGTLEVYEQQTSWEVVAESSQLVVIWGADPVNTNQIGWIIPDHGAYPGMQALKAKGTKVIVIDPMRTETVDFFNAEWLAIRPHTDVALMLGIAHTLYTEKLHDQAFLAKYTTGFDKFLPYLLGNDDKQVKSAEWASTVCEIPAETIKELARAFAKNRTMLMSGWSIQRQHHGEQSHWMLVTLAAMLGQIGLPGGGFGLSYHYANGGSPSATGPVLPGITDGSKVTGAAWLAQAGVASIPLARVADMLLNPGKTIDFNGKQVKYPTIKLCYWVGGNPFSHHQDRNLLIKAWQKLETVIVHDYQWTPTARQADIVLPATTSFEREDIEQLGDYSLKAIVAMRKVVEPMFEARDDFEIFRAISAKLGKEKDFSEGKSQLDWIKSFYKDCETQAKAKRMPLPDFDTFWNREGIIEFPVEDAARKFVRYQGFREQPMLEPLGTPSGKIEIYSRNIEKMNYDDCPPHPKWMEPIEWLGSKKAEKYPFHVDTKHPLLRLHSQLSPTGLRAKYEVKDREPVFINPKDASARGIQDGDIVRVFNDRGQVLGGAVVSERVRPSVIVLHEGGWYDPVTPLTENALDKHGDANLLVVDIGTSKLAQGNCGHTGLAQVEKFKGSAPEVTVFKEPARKTS